MRNGKLEGLQRALGDQRSRRVVFVSRCILNENVRYLGGATRRRAVDEVVDAFQAAGMGFCQMPCPELRFNATLMSSARIAGEGYFVRAVRRGLARRRLDIPFAEHDLAAELQGEQGRAIAFQRSEADL